MFADTHCHTLMKYLHDDNTDIWKSYKAPLKVKALLNTLLGIPAYSQSDFNQMARGNVQLVFCALHPPEQKIVQHNLTDSSMEDDLESVAAQIISIPKNKINEYQKPSYDHFELLKDEMSLLMTQMGTSAEVIVKSKKRVASYRIVRNFTELKQIIDFNRTQTAQHVIAVVPTIEGLHALGRGHVNFKNQPTNSKNVNNATFLKRLDVVKGITNDQGQGWTFTPIVANLTHAFDNGICGHAQALSQMFQLLFQYAEPYGPKNGPQVIEGLNKGFSDFGKTVIKKMLGIDGSQGKRIIPDIKHMSAQARHEYYQLLDEHQSNHPNDVVPVIMSHAAVNGKASVSADLDPADSQAEYDASNTFNPWSINLYDDEIVRIYKSRGLIGLIFDERVLTGCSKLKELKIAQKQGDDIYKQWAEQFANHIHHIVKTVFDSAVSDPHRAWENICIGSDFDGQINPVNAFKRSTRFTGFKRQLTKRLKKNRFDDYRGPHSPEFLADRICFWNVYHFLERNF